MRLFIAILAAAVAAFSIRAQASEDGVLVFRQRNMYPEGMDWDAKHNRFIVGSMNKPSLFTLSPAGRLDVFASESSGLGIAGVRVDRPRNRVLAVLTSFAPKKPAAAAFGALVGYDLDTKERVLFARLDQVVSSSDQKPQPNDVAVDSQGNAYVTNSIDNFIWRVTPAGVATIFTEDPLLKSQAMVVAPDDLAAPCGLNGLVYHQRGDCLLVVQSNSGALFKVHLETARVELVRTQRLPGADGAAFRKDGALVVVSSSKAWLLQTTRGWSSANVEDELQLNASSCFPTSATVTKGFKLEILCSHLPDFIQGNPRNEFSIRHVEFPKDALDDPIWLILVIILIVVVLLGWRFHLMHFFNEVKKKRN